jgi:ketosteroid isomerase-like protein
MKTILPLFIMAFFSIHVNGQKINDSTESASLDKATAAIRDAFEKGDAALVAKLHSPDIVKYFGGNNVVVGRAALEKGLKNWFQEAKVEFIENTVESTVFNGRIAIQTGIFTIKTIPKNGTKPSIGRGRSMVVYIRDESSPTGWLSLREMAQAAPDKPE